MSETVLAGGLLSSGTYFGRVTFRAPAPGFALTETVYGPGDDLPPHAHERAFFCLTLDGSYTERTSARRETAYEPWTAVFHPAGETHVTRMGSSGGRILNVEVEPTRVADLGDLAPQPGAAVDLDGGDLVWLLARILRASRAGGADAALDVEALGSELLACVARAGRREGRRPAWLARAEERLRAEEERPLSVREIARAAGVHPVHLARVFRRVHGVPPGTYRRRLKVRRACRLLRDHALGLAEAAALAGFADQSHLTREFRAVAGTTPAAFRRAAS